MYYPYLRGKQFELMLLRENAPLISKNKIHPIIEPVKTVFTPLIRAMKVLNEESVDCTLIVNPRVGQKPVKPSSIFDKLINNEFKNYKNISLGIILHAELNIELLISALGEYSNFDFSLLHYGYPDVKNLSKRINGIENIKTHIFFDGYSGKLYQRHFDTDVIKKILIRNGYRPQKRNADYPPNEHFSDLHATYKLENMDGFGDYLTVGDEYSESGGPAYAVAIHLTYLDSDDDMFIYHFLSDQTDSPTDPGGKFLEALTKLKEEIQKSNSPIYLSNACKTYLDLSKKKHFPGLGFVKKLSMQHHLELIADYMNTER